MTDLPTKKGKPSKKLSAFLCNMSHSLNSLKGVYIEDYIGDYSSIRAIKGDIRSFGYSSYEAQYTSKAYVASRSQ